MGRKRRPAGQGLFRLGQTQEDQKYVLAWFLLTAQKAGRLGGQ